MQKWSCSTAARRKQAQRYPELCLRLAAVLQLHFCIHSTRTHSRSFAKCPCFGGGLKPLLGHGHCTLGQRPRNYFHLHTGAPWQSIHHQNTQETPPGAAVARWKVHPPALRKTSLHFGPQLLHKAPSPQGTASSTNTILCI